MCEESASFDWTSSEIASAVRELTDLSEKLLTQVEAEGQGGSFIPDSDSPSGERSMHV